MPETALTATLDELRKLGTDKTRKTYARHGMAPERCLGVSVADLKTIAKKLSKDKETKQRIAYDLFDSGYMEAMYLAGIIADGKPMTPERLDQWAEGAIGLSMVSDYTVPWVTVENSAGRAVALKWMASKKEHVACCGWRSYIGLLQTIDDSQLDLDEVRKLLSRVAREIHSAPNRVRSSMNSFVIAAGAFVEEVSAEAMGTARKIGKVAVDVGDTDCKIPLAAEAIAKAIASGKLGKKKKTIRC